MAFEVVELLEPLQRSTLPLKAKSVSLNLWIQDSSLPRASTNREAKETLKGKDLDLFVVNSFGSLAQSACILLLLPLLAPLRGIPLSGLPGYLAEGELRGG